MSKEKPPEYREFERLTQRLLSVPKKDLDKKMRLYEAKKSKPAKRRPE